jgi:hypothetical protein
MSENAYQLHARIRQQGVYLMLDGPLSQSLMENIVGTIRHKMAADGVRLTTIMDVFAVAVELVQNMIRYSAETIPATSQQPDFRFGTLIIGAEPDRYFVMSGNQVTLAQVEPLRERLTMLGRMTKEELKQYYKMQRKKPLTTDEIGAGLGLIEIARKACQPLEFEFQPLDADTMFFSLKVVI